MASGYVTGSPAQRVVRAFISSTFRDMQAEREELVKRTFPQLRKLCEERGITWGEVDLRWGVSDEQKAEGMVLPICLAEIRNCRPYFIGLLGERYGWVQEEISPGILEQEPWLKEYRGRSVTELEILHGVLNDPGMAEHAVFYFRDPAYIQSLPAAEQAAFRESPTAEEIGRYGTAEAERRAEERRQKLIQLKERIRASGLRVRESYATPRMLGELVLADLTSVIDRLYPVGSQPDSLDRQAAEHEVFAQSRTRVYIGRQEYFDRLDEHARGDSPPLAILGESGSGKSALLANWSVRYRASHAGELALMHFIGSSSASTDWAALVRRILGEFNRCLGTSIAIPDKSDALGATFANALYSAATKGHIVLILDGLNQIEDRDGAPDLVWLPPVLPSAVRLVVSTLPGRPLDELKKRRWPTLEVTALSVDERRLLITDYLKQYTKKLSSVLAEQIATATPTANPLYMRALLEELRLWGDSETLKERIGYYLSASTPEGLYGNILERWERDYERDRPGLVRDVMSAIWAARRGLSEIELLELLGMNGRLLPQANWSPLHLAAEQSLVNRSGLLVFSHNHVREAVERRYLTSDIAKRHTHHMLGTYFRASESLARRAEEAPWQFLNSEEWEDLEGLMRDLPFRGVATARGGHSEILARA